MQIVESPKKSSNLVSFGPELQKTSRMLRIRQSLQNSSENTKMFDEILLNFGIWSGAKVCSANLVGTFGFLIFSLRGLR